MNPAKVKKAARHSVRQLEDGSYSVHADTKAYRVYRDFVRQGLACTCQARHDCSHILAVVFYQQQRKEKANAA